MGVTKVSVLGLIILLICNLVYGMPTTQDNPCVPSPCQNNGLCMIDTEGSFGCLCSPKYKGNLCQIQSNDPCTPSPCRNNGRCISSSGYESFTCICTSSFRGLLCQYPAVINTQEPTRLLSITTKADANTYELTRVSPTTNKGTLDKDECEEGPCAYGQCIDKINDFYCECHVLFEGKRCINLKPWVILTFALIVITYFSLCFCCVCSRINNKKAKTTTPGTTIIKAAPTTVMKTKPSATKITPASAPVTKTKPSATKITPAPAPIGRPNRWLY